MDDAAMAEPGSAAWFQLRVGNLGASLMPDLVAKLKSGKPAASRANVIERLVIERLTGATTQSFVSAAMTWGVEQEPYALEAYAQARGVFLLPGRWVPHPTIYGTGATPDRFVDDDGLVEAKAPTTGEHLSTLLGEEGSGLDKYLPQVMWQLAVTGRAWADFISWDPRLPEPYRLHCVRVERNDTYIAMLTGEVESALAEVEDRIARIRSLVPTAPPEGQESGSVGEAA